MSVNGHRTISRRSDELRRLRNENEHLRHELERTRTWLQKLTGMVFVPLDDPAVLHKTLKDALDE